MKDLVLPDIEAYAEAHSWSESPVCRALREDTYRNMEYPQMVVGPLEGAFLKMMTQVVQAKQVLEIGTFTGYSALCFAEALPERRPNHHVRHRRQGCRDGEDVLGEVVP